MNEQTELIYEMTEREYDGNPFNGPSLMKTLSGLTTDQVYNEKTTESYSVFGIVLHLLYWKYSLCVMVGGTGGFEKFPYPKKDWPEVPQEKTGEEWSLLLENLGRTHRAYMATLEELQEDRLPEELPDWKCSTLTAISWMATHDLYHTAQIRNMGV